MVWGGGVRPCGNLTSWPRQHHQLALHRLGTPPRRRAGKGLAPLSDHPRALPDPRPPCPASPRPRAGDDDARTAARSPFRRRRHLGHRPAATGRVTTVIRPGAESRHRIDQRSPTTTRRAPSAPATSTATPPESARRGDGAPGEPDGRSGCSPTSSRSRGPTKGRPRRNPPTRRHRPAVPTRWSWSRRCTAARWAGWVTPNWWPCWQRCATGRSRIASTVARKRAERSEPMIDPRRSGATGRTRTS